MRRPHRVASNAPPGKILRLSQATHVCTLTFHGIRSLKKIVSLLVWTHIKGFGWGSRHTQYNPVHTFRPKNLATHNFSSFQSFSRMLDMKTNNKNRLFWRISKLVSERQGQKSHWFAVNIHRVMFLCQIHVFTVILCSIDAMRLILCTSRIYTYVLKKSY